MGKHRAIPKGYMTVGEVAKKMNTTVRTLQYYDKENILSPSAESEGGRRLYTDKDIIKLHQIQSMKYLGFSLDDIKNRLVSLETPADVANALTEQAKAIRDKITCLSESLQAIEALQEEVLQMQSVNFKKYADIIVNLQMKNEYYWMIKHFDFEIIDTLLSRFDNDGATAISESFTHLLDWAAQNHKSGVKPESVEGQEFAQKFWDKVIEFSGGGMAMITKLMEAGKKAVSEEGKHKQEFVNKFIKPALDAYFRNIGINPFEGED